LPKGEKMMGSCKYRRLENDQLVTYTCDELKELAPKWKEEYRSSNRITMETKSRAYDSYCQQIDEAIAKCSHEYYQCDKCPKEDHEGMYCRCEMRNIALGKKLRAEGRCPWMQKKKASLSKENDIDDISKQMVQ
jgi:hypothetical protein